MKPRKGYVYEEKAGRWYARFTYTDNGGKRHNVKRRVQSKSHGNEVLKQLIREFDKGGGEQIEASRIDFNHLCDFYEKHYLMDAKYVNNRKVAGLRSASGVRGYVKVFREHFGRQKLKDVTYEHLRTFRNERLCSSTHQSKQRSLSTVNRELAYLRRLFNIAERNGWVGKNPFKKGDALIHSSDEVKRERILTPSEELNLLSHCTGRRTHLRPLIIAAIDTGCRQGELFKLQWRDIEFATGVITIRAFNTKTMRERSVSVTNRLRTELEELVKRDTSPKDLVFGIKTDVRGAFRRLCREAGLAGLRFHDLRHTHATRLDELGFSLAKIGGQLGHTVLQTTLRYVNRDMAAVQQVGIELDKFNVRI
ncbi:MAG: phage integrase [Acidobacteria bacterium OLB17]|nr:MAG: phage integrase [Acidobacteria bacterium OLB17]MCZ2390512.1 site-specific integrase [Acidobacteriota bacterium]